MSQKDRLTERLMQLESAIRRGGRSQWFLPIGIPSLVGAFALVSLIASLGLYYGNKKRYTDVLTGKVLFRELIPHALLVGAAVALAGAGGLYAWRRWAM